VRYQFIQQYQGQFTLSALCRVMQVARSGYYAWKQRAPSKTEQANLKLTEQIKTVFLESDQTYGSPRIYEELQELGIAGSEKRIARLMRLGDLKAVLPRRFVVTTDSNHDLPIAENLLDRAFTSDTPDRRWTADITYVWTSEGWLYLAVILDLFSRRIVGWSMDTTLERSLVLSALEMALTSRTPEAGLLCHSDRGSQYASLDYQKALEKAGATCSMSRKGNCWDNAPTESFFASLKKEMVYRTHFATRFEAKVAIFSWIEVWYNRKRRHSSLGYLSPEAFEKQYRQEPQRAIAA
jgi:transposase InsO family protein